MAFRALGVTVVLTGLMFAPGGCGDDEETPGAAPDRGPSVSSGAEPPATAPDGPSASSAAERLCGKYRRAVTEVRFSGAPSDQAKDFRAAARAAQAARGGTREEDLGTGGRDYLSTLDTLIPAYEDAAVAVKKDTAAFDRALDVAEPADEALDTLADRAGLERCSLDEPRAGEKRVSQSGFAALIVPNDPFVPPDDESSLFYPVGRNEAITLDRGPRIPTGTVPPVRAARTFEKSNPPGTIEPTGPLGDRQVPMRGYRYKQEKDRGTLSVFSGHGHLWVLSCRSMRPNGPSPELKAACTRAVETAGFLMF